MLHVGEKVLKRVKEFHGDGDGFIDKWEYTCLAWSPDGRLLASTDAVYVNIFNAVTPTRIQKMDTFQDTEVANIGWISWSPCSKLLFCLVDYDGTDSVDIFRIDEAQ